MANKTQRQRQIAAQVREVEAILRQWDPIGVSPGAGAPLDEYDNYAPHIVSMVASGCSHADLSNHLHDLRTATIGVGENRSRDSEVAHQILSSFECAVV